MSQSEHVFLSVCTGVLRYWALTEERTLEALQTIQLEVAGLRSVVLCPNHTTFMAISESFFMLYAAANSHCLHQVPCPVPDSSWGGGQYVDSYHVLLWAENGCACLYRLPDVSKLMPMDFGAGGQQCKLPAPSPQLCEPVLLYSFMLHAASDVEARARLLGSPVVGCMSQDR